MKPRFWILFLVALLGIPGTCGLFTQDHSCCSSTTAAYAEWNEINPLKAFECCISKPQQATQASSSTGLDSPDTHYVAALPAISGLYSLHEAHQLSMQSQQYRPDQSNRYLELRVLLN